MPIRQLNNKELADAKLLKAWWSASKRDLDLTQEKAGALMGGITQGAVGQYLNGIIPLNVEAKLSFAKILKVAPNNIWLDFEMPISPESTLDALIYASDQLSLDDRRKLLLHLSGL